MDGLLTKLNAIKDNLYDNQTVSNDNDFIQLAKLDNIDDKLHELLVLIHSNYKSEMQLVKHTQLMFLSKVIDVHIESTHKTKALVNEVNNIKNSVSNKSLLTVNNLLILAGVAIGSVILIWVLFLLSPTSGDKIIKVIETIANAMNK